MPSSKNPQDMPSSTGPKQAPLTLQLSTKAVVMWREEETLRYLTRPDPKSKTITLIAKFDREATFFELTVPAKLKGVNVVTDIILRVCASSLLSLELVDDPTIPQAVQEEFESTPLGLYFTMDCPSTIIVRTDALDPLYPATKTSGGVVDAVRDLGKATALSIFIEARNTPSELHDISGAVSQGVFRTHSSRSSRFQVASMYGGVGGKLIDVTAEPAIPPSYDEAAGSPPPPPPIKLHTNKRLRRDTDSEPEHDEIARLWAEIHAIRRVQDRCKALETEIEKPKQRDKTDEDLLKASEKEKLKLKQQLESKMSELTEKNEELEDRLVAVETKNQEFADTYDSELRELRDEVDKIQGVITYIQEGQISKESLEVIRNVFVHEIAKRLVNV